MRVTASLLRRVSAGASWANRVPEYSMQCRIKNVFTPLSFGNISPFTIEGFAYAMKEWENMKANGHPIAPLAWAMAIARIINQSPAIAVLKNDKEVLSVEGVLRSRVFKSLISEDDALATLPDELLAILILEGFIE